MRYSTEGFVGKLAVWPSPYLEILSIPTFLENWDGLHAELFKKQWQQLFVQIAVHLRADRARLKNLRDFSFKQPQNFGSPFIQIAFAKLIER